MTHLPQCLSLQWVTQLYVALGQACARAQNRRVESVPRANTSTESKQRKRCEDTRRASAKKKVPSAQKDTRRAGANPHTNSS